MIDTDLVGEVRDFLTPLWWSIHRSDIAWRRSRALPAVASYAMCRHSTALLMRLARDVDLAAGVSPRSEGALYMRWRPVRGQVMVDRLPMRPAYLTRYPTHFVLMDADGMTTDVTADQFGLDPFASRHHSELFGSEPMLHSPVPGLYRTLREWTSLPGYADLLRIAARIYRPNCMSAAPAERIATDGDARSGAGSRRVSVPALAGVPTSG